MEPDTHETPPVDPPPVEPTDPLEPPPDPPPPYSAAGERDAVFARALAALEPAPAEPEGGTPGAPSPGEGTHPNTPDPDAPGEPEGIAPPGAGPEEPEAPAPPTSADYATLAADRARLAADRRAWQAQQDAGKGRIELIEQLGAARGAEAVRVLRELGVDYADLTRAVIADPSVAKPKPPPPTDETARKEIADLRQQLDDHRRQMLTAEASRGVRSLVEAQPAEDTRWELLKAYPDYDQQVISLIEKEWAQRGGERDPAGNAVGTLTFEAAADTLEKYLFEQATRFSSAKKVRAIYGAEPAQPPLLSSPVVPPANGSAAPPATVPTAQTLTTAHASTAAPVTDSSDPDACQARALAVLDRQFGPEQ